MPHYVNWTGSLWLVKEQAEFERQKAEDAGHPMRWWEEWRLLPDPGAGSAAEALAAARATWGDNGEQWGNPRAD